MWGGDADKRPPAAEHSVRAMSKAKRCNAISALAMGNGQVLFCADPERDLVDLASSTIDDIVHSHLEVEGGGCEERRGNREKPQQNGCKTLDGGVQGSAAGQGRRGDRQGKGAGGGYCCSQEDLRGGRVRGARSMQTTLIPRLTLATVDAIVAKTAATTNVASAFTFSLSLSRFRSQDSSAW